MGETVRSYELPENPQWDLLEACHQRDLSQAEKLHLPSIKTQEFLKRALQLDALQAYFLGTPPLNEKEKQLRMDFLSLLEVQVLSKATSVLTDSLAAKSFSDYQRLELFLETSKIVDQASIREAITRPMDGLSGAEPHLHSKAEVFEARRSENFAHLECYVDLIYGEEPEISTQRLQTALGRVRFFNHTNESQNALVTLFFDNLTQGMKSGDLSFDDLQKALTSIEPFLMNLHRNYNTYVTLPMKLRAAVLDTDPQSYQRSFEESPIKEIQTLANLRQQTKNSEIPEAFLAEALAAFEDYKEDRNAPEEEKNWWNKLLGQETDASELISPADETAAALGRIKSDLRAYRETYLPDLIDLNNSWNGTVVTIKDQLAQVLNQALVEPGAEIVDDQIEAMSASGLFRSLFPDLDDFKTLTADETAQRLNERLTSAQINPDLARDLENLTVKIESNLTLENLQDPEKRQALMAQLNDFYQLQEQLLQNIFASIHLLSDLVSDAYLRGLVRQHIQNLLLNLASAAAILSTLGAPMILGATSLLTSIAIRGTASAAKGGIKQIGRVGRGLTNMTFRR